MIYLSGKILPGLPAMMQPGIGNRIPDDVPWAADNGRYANPAKYTDERFLAWLEKKGPDRCLFATAPDVVGDAEATLALSVPMFDRIKALGFPVALVAQDGLEDLPVPWDDFDVLFIGGSTDWKLSERAFGLIAEAKQRGKWVHMGRVNSLKRLRLAASVGCDSVDGTYLKFGPDVNGPKLQGWLDDLAANPMMVTP